ncbi:hypothetical protein [Roseateles amylovorans]|uniref:Uncharacterized protein n=1 Tax=Roseateles amylovorans TaxID=2978473 RepID=A0ABY6AZM7_9BURK|nr:hypothetical protein [Roseateles amylovorans]UXH77194.1 hypothetical protein N4261_19570 [Roseateles amylovorans]
MTLQQTLAQALAHAQRHGHQAPRQRLDLRHWHAREVSAVPRDIWRRLAGSVDMVQMPQGWTPRDFAWLAALAQVNMVSCSDLPQDRHPFDTLPPPVRVVITPEPHPDWRADPHRHRLFLSTAKSGDHAYLDAHATQHLDAQALEMQLRRDGLPEHWPSPQRYQDAMEAACQLVDQARSRLPPFQGADVHCWPLDVVQAKVITDVIEHTPLPLLSSQGRTAFLALQHNLRPDSRMETLAAWKIHLVDVAVKEAAATLLQPASDTPALLPLAELIDVARQRRFETRSPPLREPLAAPATPERRTGDGHVRQAQTARRPLISRANSEPHPSTQVRATTMPAMWWSAGPLHFPAAPHQSPQAGSLATLLLPPLIARGLGLRPSSRVGSGSPGSLSTESAPPTPPTAPSAGGPHQRSHPLAGLEGGALFARPARIQSHSLEAPRQDQGSLAPSEPTKEAPRSGPASAGAQNPDTPPPTTPKIAASASARQRSNPVGPAREARTDADAGSRRSGDLMRRLQKLLSPMRSRRDTLGEEFLALPPLPAAKRLSPFPSPSKRRPDPREETDNTLGTTPAQEPPPPTVDGVR